MHNAVHVKSEPRTQQMYEQHVCRTSAAVGAAANAEKTGSGTAAVPIDPQGSACGLTCVLLLMEGVAAPRDLFAGDMHASSLACEAVWVHLPTSTHA